MRHGRDRDALPRLQAQLPPAGRSIAGRRIGGCVQLSRSGLTRTTTGSSRNFRSTHSGAHTDSPGTQCPRSPTPTHIGHHRFAYLNRCVSNLWPSPERRRCAALRGFSWRTSRQATVGKQIATVPTRTIADAATQISPSNTCSSFSRTEIKATRAFMILSSFAEPHCGALSRARRSRPAVLDITRHGGGEKAALEKS